MIDEIRRNVDLDTAENIYYFLESAKVDDDIVIDRLTSNLGNFISKVFYADSICFS